MDQSLYRRARETRHADIGDELVALDESTGDCFGFNEVAAVVWRHLEAPKTFDQLRDTLLTEFDVRAEQCTAELRELLDELVDKGLVTAEID